MRGALRDARVTPDQVNYINAHGASTVLADAAEVEAIKQVFGDHAYRIPINATKSMLGHCLTAAGLVELVALLVQMEGGYLHPTINLDEPEPGFDLDFVPHVARRTTSISRSRIRSGSAASTPAWRWAVPRRARRACDS